VLILLLTCYASELLSNLLLLLLCGFDLQLHLLNILVLHHEFLVFNGLLLLSSHFELLQQSQLVLGVLSLLTLLWLHLQLLLLFGELLLLILKLGDDDLLLLEPHLQLLELQQHLLGIIPHLVLLLSEEGSRRHPCRPADHCCPALPPLLVAECAP